jgi:hypothetical protein
MNPQAAGIPAEGCRRFFRCFLADPEQKTVAAASVYTEEMKT